MQDSGILLYLHFSGTEPCHPHVNTPYVGYVTPPSALLIGEGTNIKHNSNREVEDGEKGKKMKEGGKTTKRTIKRMKNGKKRKEKFKVKRETAARGSQRKGECSECREEPPPSAVPVGEEGDAKKGGATIRGNRKRKHSSARRENPSSAAVENEKNE